MSDGKQYKPVYFDEGQVREISFDIIINSLEGLPIGHALHVLDETKRLLLDCHVVNPHNPQFNIRYSEFLQESLTSHPVSCGRHQQ